MTGATDDSLNRYTGRELDTETGLNYDRARYYDTNSERFIGQDPIGFQAGDSNLYRYVGNETISNIDSFGIYSRNLQVLMAMAKGGTNKRVYIGYPMSPDYRTAFLTATNWFYLITVPNTREQINIKNSPIGLGLGCKRKLTQYLKRLSWRSGTVSSMGRIWI